MLVLTRKKNEEICINDDIVLTVLRIQGGKVRIGIKCPEKIPIRRSEVQVEMLGEVECLLEEHLVTAEHLVV